MQVRSLNMSATLPIHTITLDGASRIQFRCWISINTTIYFFRTLEMIHVFIISTVIYDGYSEFVSLIGSYYQIIFKRLIFTVSGMSEYFCD